MKHRLLHLALSATFAAGLGACVSAEREEASPAYTTTSTTVALSEDFLLRIFNARCVTLEDLAEQNPDLDERGWLRWYLDRTIIGAERGHVVVDEAAIAACEAAITGDDCAAVDEQCFPLERFFIGQLTAGEACANDLECVGSCWGAVDGCGVCVDCADDEQYDGTRCVHRAAIGEACADTNDCARGVCRTDTEVCGLRSSLGGVCASSADCQSGACVDDVCVSKPEVGEACAVDDVCALGAFCDAGVCVAAPSQGPCSSAGCSADAICVYEDGSAHCEVSRGQPCTSSWSCALNDRCDQETSTCVPALSLGDDCSEAADACIGRAGCFYSLFSPPRCKAYEFTAGLGDSCAAVQCSEGVCVATANGDICVDVTFGGAVGDACTPNVGPTCGSRLACDAATARCVESAPVPLGGNCTNSSCANDMVSAHCLDGTCVALPGVGERCHVGPVPCDMTEAVCDFSTNRCVAGALGDACGSCVPGSFCSADGTCVEDDGILASCE